MPSTELRTYFGPPELAVYGALHLPADLMVHGTVAIFAPLAKEQGDALRGIRRLAGELADAGLAVLRFDYYGTGDSALEAGRPEAVDDWTLSGRHAIDFLRALHPSEPAVIAIRAGALIAAGTATTPSALVLWEPVLRGRSFVRSQQALASLTVGAPVENERATWVGMTMHTDAIAAMSGLTVAPETLDSSRTLVVSSDGAPDAVYPRADHLRSAGTAQFFQATSHLVRIPDATVEDIVAWTIRALARGERREVTPVIRERAVVATPHGLIEERIETIGGVAAIRALPMGHCDSSGAPGVVSFATANDSRSGPNRMWVDVGRAVAGIGGSALRFDRRGCAESGRVAADEAVALFTDTALDDARAVATTVAVAQDLVVAGICSGSWYAAHLAREGRAAHAVLVNTVLYSWRLKRSVTDVDGTADLGVPRTDPAFTSSLRGRIKQTLRSWLPYPLWHALGQRGITQVPGVLLREIAASGAQATLVLSPDDARWFDDQRGPEGLRHVRHRRAEALTQLRPPAGDHPGYHPDVRAAVSSEIIRWCRERL